MAKIVSILRKTGGMENVPQLVVVGQPIAANGAVVDKIIYRKYETEYLQGPHFQVDFKDSLMKAIIPLGAVLEVLYETQQKKEKVEVPGLA